MLRGTFFRDGCNDQGEQGEPPPLKGQQVTWRQGGGTVSLGSVDAHDSGTITTTVTVPATATPGPAQITVGTSTPVTLTVTGS